MSDNTVSKSWVFTLNNFSDAHVEYITGDFAALCTVCYVSKEVGESGTPHLQGFFRLKKAKRFTGLKKLIPQAHFEVAKASTDENAAYVFKVGSELLIRKDEGGQGRRSDITNFLTKWRSEGLRTAVQDDVSTYVRYGKGLDKAFAALYGATPRTSYPNVVWLFGPTGIGKTGYAETLDGDYIIINNYPWFDGYLAQQTVVLDELEKWEPQISDQKILQLLDRYPMRVQVKGSTVEFNPANILITTTPPPEVVFQNPEMRSQLMRRVGRVLTRDTFEEEWRDYDVP